MKNAITSGLLQALNIRCVIPVIGILVLVFLSSSEMLIRGIQKSELLPVEFVNTFFNESLSSDAVVSFLPVLAGLPFSGAYVEDMKVKFTRSILIRCNYIEYSLSRFLVAFLLGGGTIVLGALVAWAVAAVIFLPNQLAGEQDFELVSQISGRLLLLFCNGGLWSVVGITMSTLMESKYIAYASPFITYYSLVILCKYYFPQALLLYPPRWMNPEPWPFGAWGASTFLMELVLVFGVLFVHHTGKKLREL